ncbi:hypothetical protein A11A3_06121 [Alcanivorax hongdengensis A-11-3]|uniref:DUF4350 domain-containing protein n=1 Tax=Alcanivorax hongdengensis A-11-3 TaxID=1177179 RepID=L0WFT8_9GAMM|nr:DUF4350 domain-containing protein [Alcanivorax hongdengensis]EKF75007.1 hypothetical protein A11A3_06121 [Alcanivorax hongdengensis A-11-3]
MRKLPWILAILAIALGIGYYSLTEPVSYMRSVPVDSHIRNNPFAAAQQFLERQGQTSRRILSGASLFPLPDTNVTLVIDKQRGELSKDQVAQLLDWVHAGGEMIVAARPLPDSVDEKTVTDEQLADNDPLLYPLGITIWSTQETDQDSEGDDKKEEELDKLINNYDFITQGVVAFCLSGDVTDAIGFCEKKLCEAPPQPEPLVLHGDKESRERRIQLYSDHELWHDSWNDTDDEAQTPTDNDPRWPVSVIAYADNEQGSQLIQLQLGDGLVTVLTDLSLWDNQHLLYFDHAWLLNWLTGGNQVWFVRSVMMPPLPQWLWLQAPALISALMVLLALWLWRRSRRTGPRIQWRHQQQRDYLEHLHASGYFLWRNSQYRSLLAPLREQAEQHLKRLDTRRERALAQVARRLDTSTEQLEQALTAQPDNREHFTRQVEWLQKIRSDA